MAPKAALYLRVSTDKQHAENQLQEVEALARLRGFDPVVYGETISAAAKKRPKFEEMMADARKGKLKAVAVWALDRLHRSMSGLVRDLAELERLGVRVLSVQESWVDVEGPQRELMIAIFGWVAQQERRMLIERTNAGLERARAAGTKLGRPRASPVLLASAVARVKAGGNVKHTAEALGLSERTLRRALKAPAAA